MISSIRGTVLTTAGGSVIVDVGGIGFTVNITPNHALTLRIGSEATILTTLLVREDSLTLYGFDSADGLTVFDLLMGVTGVGAKSAMGVLSALSPDDIARAVRDEDDAVFRKVSGIGPKTAKLIVISLAGKLHVTPGRTPVPATATASLTDSVTQALVGLGWSERVAAQAIDEIIIETPEAERNSAGSLLRLSLARLGPAAQAGTHR